MPMWLLIPMCLLNAISVYLGVIALFTFKRRSPYPKAAPENRFAVVIPARNEERVIGNLIRALKQQDYPRDKIDVYAVLNGCTDGTEAVAREAGAKIINCQGRIACKGDALHEAFEQLLPMDYDAFAVFDADNVPVPDFIQRMNDALAAGERVCKGRLKSGNALESWVSGGYGLYHALMEWTYSRPHSAAGFSSNLVGTAFAFHRQVLEELGGWNTVSLCEDTEFLAQATRLGHRVAWVPEALSYDEQVSRFGVSLRQRLRWCCGMIRVARNETGKLLSPACPKRGMALDLAVLFIISHTAPLATVLMIVSLFFQTPLMLALTAASLVASFFGMQLLAIALCLLGGYPVRRMKRTIALFPVFMASWLPVQIYALFEPMRRWDPIEHNGQESIDELKEA